MLLSQRYYFPKEKMRNKFVEKNFKTSPIQHKLFEASSFCLQHKERKSSQPCSSEDINEQEELQFSTNLADSNFLRSPALNVSCSPSNTIKIPFPFRCSHTIEMQTMLQNTTQKQPVVSNTLSKHSSSFAKNIDSQCHFTADKSPHYDKTLNHITDSLPNLHTTKLFLDLQKDSTCKSIQGDRSNLTTTSTTAHALTTSTTENLESPFNEFCDLGNLQNAEALIIPTSRHSKEKLFTNSRNDNDSSTIEFATQTEEVDNKVNLNVKSRPFLRKGARNPRSKIIKQPEKTYQYYSNAVAKTFSTADPSVDGTFQTNNDSKGSTLFSLKLPCQKDEEKNELDAICRLTNETFLQWEKNVAETPISNTDPFLESCDKNDTQLSSSRDLEILRVQAQAKMALVDEQLTKLKDFQATLENKKEIFLKEKQNFLLEQERQRIEFHAEREEMLSDIQKKKDFLKKEKNKIFTQIESFEMLIKEKSLLESQVQKISRQIKEQEEDFRNRETRYRNIIDRLNCKLRMLESKVSVLQQTAEKNIKLRKESQIFPSTKTNKGFKEPEVNVVNSWNPKDVRPRTLQKDSQLPYRLSRSTPIPSTTTHRETESDIVSTVSKHSAEYQSETNPPKHQENMQRAKGRLSNFKRLLEFDLKEKWSSFDEALASLGKPLALTLREPPITKTKGRQDFFYNDGHTEIVFSNGIRKVTLPNGWVFTFFTNGDIRGVNARGVLYYYYYNDSIYSITEVDGTLFNYFPDHQLDCIYPDQTIQVRYPNKILKQIDAKGVEYVEKYHSDSVF